MSNSTKNTCLMKSLTRACRLTNDRIRIRLPIQRDVLNSILRNTEKHFRNIGQVYLSHLYLSLFATTYFGLFRVGEVTQSDHKIMVNDVHLAENKRKLLFVLYSSKTHDVDSEPQFIKISGTPNQHIQGNSNNYCPYRLLQNYLDVRQPSLSDDEQFFVFHDLSPVKPNNFRFVLKQMIKKSGYNQRNYGTHSLRSGRSIDLLEMGVSVETIMKIGHWKLNSVFRYLKC